MGFVFLSGRSELVLLANNWDGASVWLLLFGWADRCLFSPMGEWKVHKILWVAVSSTLRLRVERRHHLQSVCLQDVVLVNQTDENRLGLSLVGQYYSIHLTAQT
ncbi:hypothetical protein AVEN_272440-1 [Araneus ventricosus]|uniref:Uncharacterized protein n=1 Tax=Araneus ventricosus TaxID=182803 RepID=A0A4Y2WLT2_ARAVE|nr:hypothetical protein AVEN_272440-1 [Araneus ventricosus]